MEVSKAGTKWKINVAIDRFEEESRERTCGMGTVGIVYNEGGGHTSPKITIPLCNKEESFL
jgi:hypothetical protein